MFKTNETSIDNTGETYKDLKRQSCERLKALILKRDITKISNYGIIQLALAEIISDPVIKHELLKRAQI